MISGDPGGSQWSWRISSIIMVISTLQERKNPHEGDCRQTMHNSEADFEECPNNNVSAFGTVVWKRYGTFHLQQQFIPRAERSLLRDDFGHLSSFNSRWEGHLIVDNDITAAFEEAGANGNCKKAFLKETFWITFVFNALARHATT